MGLPEENDAVQARYVAPFMLPSYFSQSALWLSCLYYSSYSGSLFLSLYLSRLISRSWPLSGAIPTLVYWFRNPKAASFPAAAPISSDQTPGRGGWGRLLSRNRSLCLSVLLSLCLSGCLLSVCLCLLCLSVSSLSLCPLRLSPASFFHPPFQCMSLTLFSHPQLLGGCEHRRPQHYMVGPCRWQHYRSGRSNGNHSQKFLCPPGGQRDGHGEIWGKSE